MQTRIEKDRRTLEAIGRIYCGAHHAGAKDQQGLCGSCREVVNSTLARTQTCPFGHTGNCQDCETHCQRGDAQAKVRQMMRYAAPRMVLLHPLMTFEYVRKKLGGGKCKSTWGSCFTKRSGNQKKGIPNDQEDHRN